MTNSSYKTFGWGKWTTVFCRVLAFGAIVGPVSCSHPPPPHWAEGGTPLRIAIAHWDRADDEPVEMDAQGRVFEGAVLRFVVDRVGRITDDEGEPIAIVFPNGQIVGTSNQYLGRVGVANAAPPHGDWAWLAIMPDGTVTRFVNDGDRQLDGRWRGCDRGNLRTCTLVSHLFLLRYYRNPRATVGVGIGVMMPL